MRKIMKNTDTTIKRANVGAQPSGIVARPLAAQVLELADGVLQALARRVVDQALLDQKGACPPRGAEQLTRNEFLAGPLGQPSVVV